MSHCGAGASERQESDSNAKLVDRFGRIHRSLRISLTDRCNIRCQYCMPAGRVDFLPTSDLLTFEQIQRVVAALAPAGIEKIRLTGGEPLVRPEVERLIALLREVEGIERIALTTNGMLLTTELAMKLKRAGLSRINISLDTLREEVFQVLTRRTGLQRALAGIDAAIACDIPLRLNAVILRSLNVDDILPLARFAQDRRLELRFIEFMPLDAERHWNQGNMVSGAEIRTMIEAELGALESVARSDPSQPAQDYRYVDHSGTIGFIDSVTQPFCGSCDRLRLTAEGKLRNCLFGHEEWDVKKLLEQGRGASEILELALDCVANKHASHGIEQSEFRPPERAMYQIGG